MFSNSAFVMILSVILLCPTISAPLPIAKTANKNPNSLSLKLLHRSSIPLFKNENFQDFLENNKQLYMKDSKFLATAPLFQATIEYLYFVNLSIGNPPVPQYLGVDTGSSLVWVIGNSTNKKFLYQGRYSTTYTSVSCRSPECSLSRNFRCSMKEGSDLCLYNYPYADGIRKSYGLLGFEHFAFTNNECDFCNDSLDKVLFGVAIFTNGSLFQGSNFNGMLGLGPQNTSLLRNFPQKFSYCIGDIFNSSSQSSFLQLGNIGDWYYHNESMYVPLYHDEYYRVNMDCIDFGEVCLSIDPDIFKYDNTNPYTGVVFDTGAVFTFLADQAYDVVANNIEDLMASRGYEVQNRDTRMCYNGQREEISDFPLLTFHFVDKDVDAHLRLRIEHTSLFYNFNPKLFCITMIKSSSQGIVMKDFTVIGLMAQQNHNILFDVENSRMSIQYTSCDES